MFDMNYVYGGLAIVFAIAFLTVNRKRGRLGLNHLRSALRVAEKDGQDPRNGIYWADNLANCCGLKNTVREEIKATKPALSSTIATCTKCATDVTAKAADEASRIKTAALMKAEKIREKAKRVQSAGEDKAYAKKSKGEEAAREQLRTATAAKADLSEIEKIESFISGSVTA